MCALFIVSLLQLALKHRQNKSQRQRIVLFVGSPLEEDERTLVRLGKKLKKYNVAVDVVNFGEQNDNAAKLEAFVNAVDSGNRCGPRSRVAAQPVSDTYGANFTLRSLAFVNFVCAATWSRCRRGRMCCRTFLFRRRWLPARTAQRRPM